jgi:hypothetical protein
VIIEGLAFAALLWLLLVETSYTVGAQNGQDHIAKSEK